MSLYCKNRVINSTTIIILMSVPEKELLIINQKHLIDKTKRWGQVLAPELYSHPHNCIGWIITTQQDKPVSGTGFLLSRRLVLTSAHTFLIEIGDQSIFVPPFSFSIMEKN